MKKIEADKPTTLMFIKSSKQHIKNIDAIMKNPESLQRGKMLAAEMNRFDLDIDRFLHFGLGIKLTRVNNVLNDSFKI